MSVVNKMLNDLEQRQQAEASYSGDYQPSGYGRQRWWLLAGVVLVAVAVAIVLFTQGLISAPSTQGTDASINQMQTAEIISGKAQISPGAVKIQLPQTAVEPQQSQMKETFTGQTPQVNSPDLLVTVEPQLSLPDEFSTAVDSDDKQGQQAEFTLLLAKADVEPPPPAAFEISNNKAADPAQLFRQQAQTALRLGDDKQAIVALESLLQIEPDNHIARKKLAALLFANGQDGQAQTLLQQGLQAYPGRVDIRQMLARLYVQKKQPDAAYNLLNEYPADALQDTDYVALRASLAQQTGRYSEARQDYQALIVAQESNPQWWLGLAICEDKLGASNEAVVAYRKVIALEQISPAVSEFTTQRITSLSGGK